MLQTQARRFTFLAPAGLSVLLACSSSTVPNGGHSTSTKTTAGASGSPSPLSGSGGDTSRSASIVAGSGGFGSMGGSTGGSSQASNAPVGGSSSELGGSNASGGTAEAGSDSKPDAGTSGGQTNTGGTTNLGGITSTGGTRTTGGTTSTGGALGDALCPPGITRTITVAKDGSGQFNTVQAAVNSIASGSSEPIRIDIKAGTYTEKLTIASRSNLCLVGASAPTTILSYGDSNASTGGTAVSASVHISADDFSAANLTFQNTFGPGSQAVALRATGQRQQFLNCRFVGYQDTLYTHDGSQYFRNCYVQGNTDFVFGGATAVLQNCEIRNVENGSAVAAPNTDAGTAFGIVFLGGKFTAASGVNSVGLGRPWGVDGFAAYLNVELGSHILAAGFVAMSGRQPQNARFHEYGSTGNGANASARSSYQLTAAQATNYTLTKIFGDWIPTYSP